MSIFKKFSTNQLIMTGNTLEYYDLYLYIHLAFVINKHFFPHIASDDPMLKIYSLISMYFVAPLASMFWGMYGDIVGRKRVLILGSVLMSISTSVIVLIPNYVWWSEAFQSVPIFLLFTIRVFQGIAMAGEPLAAKLYSIENVKKIEYKKIIAKLSHRTSPAKINQELALLERRAIEVDIPLAVTKMTMTQIGGGILALSVGYLSINCLTWEHAWRAPFLIAFLSTIYVSYLRFHIFETNEYENASLHKKDSLFNLKTIIDHLKSLRFSKETFFSCIFLSFSYPAIFVFSFTFLSPLVIKSLGYPQEFLLTYNFFVCLGEFVLIYLLVLFPVKFNFNKKLTMAIQHLGAAICVLSFYFGIIDKHLPVGVYIFIQFLMLSLINWNLIYGSILKNLSTLQRFTQMSMSFSIGRFINFFLAIFIVPYFCSGNNIENYCLIILTVLFCAIMAVYIYVPYERSDDIYFAKKRKKLIYVNKKSLAA